MRVCAAGSCCLTSFLLLADCRRSGDGYQPIDKHVRHDVLAVVPRTWLSPADRSAGAPAGRIRNRILSFQLLADGERNF